MSFSLLWPADAPRMTVPLARQSGRDLGLPALLGAITPHKTEQQQIESVLLHLTHDPEVIRYRQAVVGDLWAQPFLADQLGELLPLIETLGAYRSAVDRPRTPLEEVTWRLGELEQLATCVQALAELFGRVGPHLQAQGWQALRQMVEKTAADPTFAHLCQHLPDMLRHIRAKASVTIGVNLDGKLRPYSATLLAVNEHKFTTSTFLDKLLGKGTAALGPLHTVPEIETAGMSKEWDGREINPLMVPLFKDLAKVLETISKPLAKALTHYVALESSFLVAIRGEIAFYLAAVRLMRHWQARGVPLCCPTIATAEQRLCHITNGYNISLLAQPHPTPLVGNDVEMGDTGRIFILTGPNQGGKTTYTQMVGLCQLFAQAGLWLPAEQATLSVVDNIYTHYPTEENLALGTGRFGDEAQRLGEIFAHATPHSLILLNESLASTSPSEGVYLAQDVVRILRRMGVRAIFGTHLHELAAHMDELNEQTAGDSLVVSMVASPVVEGDGRSYKVVRGQPLGRSYAAQIARRYGLSYEQLAQTLTARGVLREG